MAEGSVHIQQISASEGLLVVGVIQALNGKMKPQVNELTQKAKDWAKRINNRWLNHRIAWDCLRQMIWPSLSYPLVVCSMSRRQGDQIITKLYRALLPELGLQKRFPWVWQYAPVQLQGLALPHPYLKQEIDHLKILAYMGMSTEILGGFLWASLEQAQLEIGMGHLILQEDFEKWGFLLTPNCWVGSVGEFVSKYGITVEAPFLVAPKKQRKGDLYLMEHFMSEDFSVEELKQLNWCQFEAQVLLLSDIMVNGGHDIHLPYHNYDERTPRPIRTSKWNWPLQQPTQADWIIWWDTMRRLSGGSTVRLL